MDKELDYELEAPSKTRRRVRLERLLRYFHSTLNILRDTDCFCVGASWMKLPPFTDEEIDQAIKDAKIASPQSDHLKLSFYKVKFYPLKDCPDDTIIIGRMCDKGD